jgi:4a-hydroxytetrahydrobiopterin dehydratase
MADERAGDERTCSVAEIEQRLKQELPLWYRDQGSICRRYRTGGWQATMLLVNCIGHLAEAAFHHPDLEVSYAAVIVRLATHSAGGVTGKDFALAREIEAVVQWQPGRDDGPLEGIPDSPRAAYIVYDSQPPAPAGDS